MYNYIVAKLQNIKLQMQYMFNILTVSDLSLSKVTSQKIFVSDDLNPDLDPVQEIARVSSETSKFFTPLQCDLKPEIDLETEIKNPTYRKIVVSSNLSPDTSADLASRKIVVSSDLAPDLEPVQEISRVFRETSKFFTPLQCDFEPEINKPTSRKIVVYSNLSPDMSSDIASRKIFVSSDLAPDPSAGIYFKGVIAQGFRGPFLLNNY